MERLRGDGAAGGDLRSGMGGVVRPAPNSRAKGMGGPPEADAPNSRAKMMERPSPACFLRQLS